jgi:hypothetical protein
VNTFDDNNNNTNITYKVSVSNNGLNIFHLNIRSLLRKLDELKILIKNQKYRPHIIIITETWLLPNNCQFYNLDGYTAVHSCRQIDRITGNGGLSVFVQNNIQFDVIKNEMFLQNHTILLKVKKYGLKIGALYRDPTSGSLPGYLNYLDRLLEKYHGFVFVGDLNVNLLRDGADVVNYRDVLVSNAYSILNNIDDRFYTFNGPYGISLIDHVFSDVKDRKFNIHVGNAAFSDHKYVYLNISSKIRDPPDDFQMTVVDDTGFRSELEARAAHFEESSVSFDSFLFLFCTILRLFQSVKTVKRRNDRDMPWFCSEIQLVIDERNYWYKRKQDFPQNEFVAGRYREFRNHVTNLIRIHKRRYYTSLININVNNLKRLWGIFNELIYNRTRNCHKVIEKVRDSFGNLVTAQVDICHVFNTYFVGVALNLRNILFNANSNRPVVSTMRAVCMSSIFATDTDENEVSMILDTLNDGSSNGYDGISVKLIKHCRLTIIPVLVRAFNSALTTCIFPELLKISKTVPIFKNGEKVLVSNYRPISVLSNFSKVFERLIYRRLESFYTRTNFFNDCQFGFLPKSNTVAAVISFITFLRDSLNRRQYTSAIFIDMSKAFDCVVHDILLEKLYKSGVRGNFHELLKSYLSNRSQLVRIGKSESSRQDIQFSVPQGSILGPLLFLVYINDVFELGLRGRLQLYADDAVLMYSRSCITDLYDDMQHDLDILNNWLYNNCLTANSGKTNFIIFKDPRKIISYNRSLYLGGSLINKVDETTYLGLIIDSSLSFRSHIDKLKKKIISFVGVLGRIKNTVPVCSRLSIYYAHVLSHICYLNVIWSAAPQYKLLELQRLQNKAIRAVFFEEYRKPDIHTADLYRSKNLLSLFQINKYETVLIIFKLKHGLLKHSFVLPTNAQVHEHETRNRYDFHIGSRVNNNYGRNCIMHHGFSLYNSLPTELKSINNLELFRKKLKQHAVFCY